MSFPVFRENKKMITNLSSAELVNRVVTLKQCDLVLYIISHGLFLDLQITQHKCLVTPRSGNSHSMHCRASTQVTVVIMYTVDSRYLDFPWIMAYLEVKIWSLFKHENLTTSNRGDPDQMPHSVASDLDLHCLPVNLFWVSFRLKWVNNRYMYLIDKISAHNILKYFCLISPRKYQALLAWKK